MSKNKDIAMFAEIRKKYLQQPLQLPFVVSTVGECFFQAPVYRPQGFFHHHVLMVTEGEGSFRLGEETFRVSAGDGVFCRAGVPHAYQAVGDRFRTLWVTFLGGESVLGYYHIGDSLRFRATPALNSATLSLYHFCTGNSTVLTRSAAGYTWLTDWLNDCFAPSAPVTEQVRRFLEAHFSEQLTLDQIAQAVHMSRYALCHHYKENCGTTVMEQLRKVRIAKAKQLLQFSAASVEEIGQSCGFESPSYFSKLFRQETGLSPREYRTQKIR